MWEVVDIDEEDGDGSEEDGRGNEEIAGEVERTRESGELVDYSLHLGEGRRRDQQVTGVVVVEASRHLEGEDKVTGEGEERLGEAEGVEQAGGLEQEGAEGEGGRMERGSLGVESEEYGIEGRFSLT